MTIEEIELVSEKDHVAIGGVVWFEPPGTPIGECPVWTVYPTREAYEFDRLRQMTYSDMWDEESSK